MRRVSRVRLGVILALDDLAFDHGPNHMRDSDSVSGTTHPPDKRLAVDTEHTIAGISVREEDIEPIKGITTIATLFRGMAILITLLMILQVIFGLTSDVPISIGVLLADAVRLIIFAGLLWAGGDLAVLWVKSHHDLRATRILMARVAYMLQHAMKPNGKAP